MIGLKRLAVLAAAAATAAAPALANERTETFVRESGEQVLQTLNDPSLSVDERSRQFIQFMEEFSDLSAVANFVIGKYARRFSDDELQRYRAAFRDYALASYESQFDQYRGESITVNGSKDRDGARLDSIVDTTIRANGRPLNVQWRVIERDGELQVLDVALNLDGNQIWLAIEQRQQFLSLLDRSNGDAEALIAKLKSLTDEIQTEMRDARAGRAT